MITFYLMEKDFREPNLQDFDRRCSLNSNFNHKLASSAAVVCMPGVIFHTQIGFCGQ